MGMALSQAGYRDKTFLMAKVGGRNKDIAQTELDQSLSWLRTASTFGCSTRGCVTTILIASSPP